MDIVIVAIAAFLTSILSALAGLGGGIILLAVIAQFFAPVTAIPIQGGIQLVSNGSRAAMLRQHISWSAALKSFALVIPGSLVGVLVASRLPVDATRILVGCFILVTVWRKGLLTWRGRNAMTEQSLYAVGAVSGLLNSTVGASGPFTSPFFRAVTASHIAFVATAATSQVAAHIAKLISFVWLDDFDIAEHFPMMAIGAVAVIAGSRVGTQLLGKIEERYLDIIFKSALTILALRLIIRAVL